MRIAHSLAANLHCDRARRPQSPLDESMPFAAPHSTERLEPPEHLATRLRSALATISHVATGELEGWELRAIRDPRRWARPALAAVAGAAVGAAVVVLGIERRGRSSSPPRDGRASAPR
jgi:hypothetical protein